MNRNMGSSAREKSILDGIAWCLFSG